MKTILFLSALSMGLFVNAQNYESIRNLVALTQFEKAKEELDKSMQDAKFTAKAEAYILKAYVYSSLAVDPKNKDADRGKELLENADAAYRKYREMEPSLALISDSYYQNAPINIYSGYYVAGYNDYLVKKWEPAHKKLMKALEYSDLLIAKKLLPGVTLDTNILILAGVTAENSGHIEDAARIYGRLADSKLNGDGYETVYRYLVIHYFKQKNWVAFEKYKALGAEVYPKSEYFTFDKVDFAVGLEPNFVDKQKQLDNLLATDPNNLKANQVMGEIIYDALNPQDEKAALPANADELEKKMVAAFRKAAAAKPEYENPWLYLGDHFINKAVRIDKGRVDHATAMKAKAKPGQPDSKEDIAKRDEWDKKYGEALEQAKEPYEKAAAIFAKRSNLVTRDKQQYKKAVSYLTDISAFKRIKAKGNAAEEAKYSAEEKKWNAIWESIK